MERLAALITEDFEVSVGVCGTTAALRHVLQKLPEVQALQTDLNNQTILVADIESFVTDLVGAFTPGVLCPYDMALAAIAVVLETSTTPFSEEYLSGLACLRLQEMPVSTRIARECLAQREATTKDK